jgi:hypothetical protein
MELQQLDARTVSVVTPAAYAPSVGDRLTRYDLGALDDQVFAAEFGRQPWEVNEVVPIDDRPGWVKLYVRPFEPATSSWGEVGILPY